MHQLVREALLAAAPDLDATFADRLEIAGRPGALGSRLATEQVAVACVGTALLSAAALRAEPWERADPPLVGLDFGEVAAAVTSERHFRLDGAPAGLGFAPLSRFWQTGDGWIRTHANYRWHRAALLDVLGVDAEVDLVASAVLERGSAELEEATFAAGGVAAAVRSAAAWDASEQGRSLARSPLVARASSGDAAARSRPVGPLPASGIRVLDLTRVIAGPVCTRFLAACGADVLRLDSPSWPDLAPGAPGDTLLGKRSALVDFASPEGSAELHELLDGADLVVCGYRPGALERFGLGADELAERHPGIVAVYLAAWGHGGPWGERRGFDSVVQAATGIAAAESPGDGAPGALPCQLLDHGTGYLAAAAALDGLRCQAHDGGTPVRRLSLARTARWLLACGEAPESSPEPDVSVGPDLDGVATVTLDSARGPITAVPPPGRFGRDPLTWPGRQLGYGQDVAEWGGGGDRR